MCYSGVHSAVADAPVRCAAIQKQAAVLSEESLAERDAALNGNASGGAARAGQGQWQQGRADARCCPGEHLQPGRCGRADFGEPGGWSGPERCPARLDEPALE